MSDGVFLIRNQLGQYWTRSGEWVDGREPQRLLKLKHHDEAVNQLVELSAKDIELRGDIHPAQLNEKKDPLIDASEHLTPTLSEQAAARSAAAAEAEEEAEMEADKQASGGTDLEHPMSPEQSENRQAECTGDDSSELNAAAAV
ncbi:MAG: hypothetical protein AB8B57_05615 [Congregibacter sp.]